MLKKINKNTIKNIKNVFLAFLAISFFITTFKTCAIPNIKDNWFSQQTVYTNTDKGLIELPKAMLAKACTELGECLPNYVLLLQGKVDNGMKKSISELKIREDLSKFDTICLNSAGGLNTTATELIDELQNTNQQRCLAPLYKVKYKGKGYNITGNYCNSACAFIFLSGNKRLAIGSGLKFGIHSSGERLYLTEDFGTTVSYKSNRFKPYIKKEHQPIFDFSHTIPSEKMYFLSESEAQKYDLFTDYFKKSEGKSLMDFGSCNDKSLNYTCPIDKPL